MIVTGGIFILYVLLIGMGAGWLAWVTLGKSSELTREGRPNWTALLALGVAGSFVGGLAASLLTGGGFALKASGLIGSFVGALVVEAVYVAIKRR